MNDSAVGVDPEAKKPSATSLREKRALRWLNFFKNWYVATENPMYLWAAISAAADADFPVPDWTTPYFQRVAARLYAVSLSQVPDEQIGSALYRALEFSGQTGNALHTIPDTSHDAEIAAAVEFELNGMKEGGFGAALLAVVREHPAECQASPKCERIQRTTVNRLWRQHKPRRKR